MTLAQLFRIGRKKHRYETNVVQLKIGISVVNKIGNSMTKSLILGISYVIPINEGIIDEK